MGKARFSVQHGSCEWKCGLNESVCSSKQKWNHDECRCDCKELDNWCSWVKGYMWNLSTCDCECNKACKIYECFDTKNCSCEKRLLAKLVSACEDEILNTTEPSHDDKE